MRTTLKQETSANVDRLKAIEKLLEEIKKCCGTCYGEKTSKWVQGKADQALAILNRPECETCGGKGTIFAPKELSGMCVTQPCPDCQSDISAILEQADKALLANKPVVTHSCIRLAIKELNNE